VEKISNLSRLNIRRRRALIEYLIREDFSRHGFKQVDLNISGDSDRVSISDDSPIIISFDISYASDYKEDAYTWCYVDFIINKPNIEIPDELKGTFTRYVDSRHKRIFWRHRMLTRIIDMDMAVEHIIKTRDRLLELLNEYGVEI